MAFLKKIFGTTQDFYKSEISIFENFQKICPLPSKNFLKSYSTPKILGQAHVWL